MESWIPIVIVIVIVFFIVGGLSTVHKTSHMPLRKQGLNDLKETLPRTHKNNKNEHSFSHSTSLAANKKNSD